MERRVYFQNDPEFEAYAEDDMHKASFTALLIDLQLPPSLSLAQFEKKYGFKLEEGDVAVDLRLSGVALEAERPFVLAIEIYVGGSCEIVGEHIFPHEDLPFFPAPDSEITVRLSELYEWDSRDMVEKIEEKLLTAVLLEIAKVAHAVFCIDEKTGEFSATLELPVVGKDPIRITTQPVNS